MMRPVFDGLSVEQENSFNFETTVRFTVRDLIDGRVNVTVYPTSNLYLDVAVRLDVIEPAYVNFKCECKDSNEFDVQLVILNRRPSKNWSITHHLRDSPVATEFCPRIKLATLVDASEGFLIDGFLTVVISHSSPCSEKNNIPGHRQELAQDLASHFLREEEALIVCSCDGEEFKINETIFAARSRELAALLKYDKLDGRLVMEGLTGRVLEQLIHFLKSDQLSEQWKECAPELAHVAEMYNLPGLFDLLEDELASNVHDDYNTLVRFANEFKSLKLYLALSKVDPPPDAEKLDHIIEVEIGGRSFSIHQKLLSKSPLFPVGEPADRAQDRLESILHAHPVRIVESLFLYLEKSKLSVAEVDLRTLINLAAELELRAFIDSVCWATTTYGQERPCHCLRCRHSDVHA